MQLRRNGQRILVGIVLFATNLTDRRKTGESEGVSNQRSGVQLHQPNRCIVPV